MNRTGIGIGAKSILTLTIGTLLGCGLAVAAAYRHAPAYMDRDELLQAWTWEKSQKLRDEYFFTLFTRMVADEDESALVFLGNANDVFFRLSLGERLNQMIQNSTILRQNASDSGLGSSNDQIFLKPTSGD